MTADSVHTTLSAATTATTAGQRPGPGTVQVMNEQAVHKLECPLQQTMVRCSSSECHCNDSLDSCTGYASTEMEAGYHIPHKIAKNLVSTAPASAWHANDLEEQFTFRLYDFLKAVNEKDKDYLEKVTNAKNKLGLVKFTWSDNIKLLDNTLYDLFLKVLERQNNDNRNYEKSTFSNEADPDGKIDVGNGCKLVLDTQPKDPEKIFQCYLFKNYFAHRMILGSQILYQLPAPAGEEPEDQCFHIDFPVNFLPCGDAKCCNFSRANLKLLQEGKGPDSMLMACCDDYGIGFSPSSHLVVVHYMKFFANHFEPMRKLFEKYHCDSSMSFTEEDFFSWYCYEVNHSVKKKISQRELLAPGPTVVSKAKKGDIFWFTSCLPHFGLGLLGKRIFSMTIEKVNTD